LQRLQAEYANYRKRVERDRAVAHESAVGAVLTELLALLDDVDRAEQHGELTGGFKAVADQLNSITSRIGLEKYGTPGEAFDPQIHEALMHDESADVAVATATKILQPGYKYKERILRPARVAVTDPAAGE
jgi:molecular chaperone GrpE